MSALNSADSEPPTVHYYHRKVEERGGDVPGKRRDSEETVPISVLLGLYSMCFLPVGFFVK